jgi:hypothetical protein
MQRGSNQVVTLRTLKIGINLFFFHHSLYPLPAAQRWSLTENCESRHWLKRS